jgi:hypothetical protein
VIHNKSPFKWRHYEHTQSRLSPCSVKVELTMSGGVPWRVAGPQPNIDFKYVVELRQKSKHGIEWKGEGLHDGFPAHEFFIESAGAVQFSHYYAPTWFSSIAKNNLIQPTCKPFRVRWL